MFSKAVATAKILVILSLLVLFIIFFAQTYVKAFMKKGVVVELSMESHPEGVPAPRVTICAGWKNESAENYRNFCKESKNVTNCILSSTNNINDFLFSEVQNFNISNEITVASHGNCFSFDYKKKLKSNMRNKEMMFLLNASLEYSAFFYDPRFFFISENPNANAGLRIDLHELETGEGKMFKINIIQRNNLHLNTQPCVADETYHFGACLRKYVESKIGCRLPWHESNLETKTVCTSLDEFNAHDKIYERYSLSELKDVIAASGCRAPCRYREVRQVGSPAFLDETDRTGFSLGPALLSTDIKVETEKLSLSFETLIANLGGTLGLFLGFSFLMIWDWFESTLNYFIK